MDFLHDLQWVLPLRNPVLTQLAVGFSWLGYPTFIIFFISLGYWTWNKAIFFRLLLLAWEVRRASFWLLCILIALGVMLSRMYLGVHDLEDVLVGAALGGASLFAFERLRRDHWPWDHSAGARVLAVAAVTGAALLVWPNGATAPDYIPLVAGILIAATWGMQWDRTHLHFVTPPQFWRKLAMCLVGTALFMGEQKLLKLLGPVVPLDPMLWSFVKGLVNGVFVSVLMPAVFVGVRLALPSAALPPASFSDNPLSAAR